MMPVRFHILSALVSGGAKGCSGFDRAPCSVQGCIKLGGIRIRYSAALDAFPLPYIHDVKNIIYMVARWHEL